MYHLKRSVPFSRLRSSGARTVIVNNILTDSLPEPTVEQLGSLLYDLDSTSNGTMDPRGGSAGPLTLDHIPSMRTHAFLMTKV